MRNKLFRGLILTTEAFLDYMLPGGGGDTLYSGLYGEALPERGAFFKLAILVYERVTKSAAKCKKWWLKRSISKGATFWQK